MGIICEGHLKITPFVQAGTTILPLIVLFSHLSSSSVAPRRFLSEPEDIVIKEGGSAIFKCRIGLFNVDTDSVTWDITPDLYDTMTVDRYDAARSEFESTITIIDVGISNQYFRCIFERRPQVADESATRISSRQAQMTVLYFPRPNDLTCEPSHQVNIFVGESLPVRCTVRRSRPAADFSWRLNDTDGAEVSLPHLRDEGRLRILSHELRGGPELDSRMITCLVTSKVTFPGRSLSCTIGPFVLGHRTESLVSPRQVTLAGETDSTDFECNVSLPAQFTWNCFPAYAFRVCQWSQDRIAVSVYTNMTSASKRLYVVCSANTDDGILSDFSTISLQQISQGKKSNVLEANPLNCTQINIMNLLNEPADLSLETTYQCQVDMDPACVGVPTPSSPWRLSWILGGSEISSEVFTEGNWSLIDLPLSLTLVTNQYDGQYLSCNLSSSNNSISSGLHVSISSTNNDKSHHNITTSPVSDFVLKKVEVGSSIFNKSWSPKLWQIAVIIVVAGLVVILTFAGCVLRYVHKRKAPGRIADYPRHLWSVGATENASSDRQEPNYEEMPHHIYSQLHESEGSACCSNESETELLHLYESHFADSSHVAKEDTKKPRRSDCTRGRGEMSPSAKPGCDGNYVNSCAYSPRRDFEIYNNDSMAAGARAGKRRISTSSCGSAERNEIIADIHVCMPPLPSRENPWSYNM